MAESTVTKKLGPTPTRKEILANWTPEDPVFWKKFGEKIAKQNLYTSTWALVLSFVVWTLWATIAAKLNMVGFHFTDEQLFTLAALPGLVGATGRLFYTYLPGLMGGRNSAFITTALLLLPLFGLGRALQDPTTSYDTFVLLVSFIGIAGANFSAALGLLVSKEFPEVSFSMAAFLGPFIGAGIRPVGGWLADRLDSGSKVTLVSLFIMLAASIVVLFGIQTHAFALFFGSFLLLFLTTGFINGASFRMIPYIFDNPFHASLVTGFTAAIAAYGAFLIPKIFGWSYANFQNVAPAFYILIAFTVLTIIITWFFYARKGSGIKC
ncbi:nitrate/nitrite transporter [Mitsuokella multacida]|uniref:nitrate/nitrite transporter n=1 Tax=Mitsuokella multacida TaxID=52226 RepID=UPI003FEE8F6D